MQLLLRPGFPLLVIAVEERVRYIGVLRDYQVAVGQVSHGTVLPPPHPPVQAVNGFLPEQWRRTLDMVRAPKEQQKSRLPHWSDLFMNAVCRAQCWNAVMEVSGPLPLVRALTKGREQGTTLRVALL